MVTQEIPWHVKWRRQCKLLLWKNYKVALRNRRGTIVQLAAPAIFIVFLFLIQKAIETDTFFGDFYEVRRTQPEEDIHNIPLCSRGPHKDFCYTFAYTPNNNPLINEVMKRVREQNDPPIPEESVIAFPDEFAIDDFLYENLNTTQAAYIFNIGNGTAPNGDTVQNLTYVIQINQTATFSHGALIRMAERILVPMQYSVEKAILQVLAEREDPTAQVVHDVKLIKFTHPEILTANVIGQDGPGWFYAALIFNFVVGMSAIVTEKELKLRDSMRIMGLYDSAYWVSWFITLSCYSTATVLILITTGAIFQFAFFLNNNFFLYFFLMELFALSMVSMTFLVSTWVKKSSAATGVGFLVFILGYFMQLGASVVFGTSSPQELRNLFSLFSPDLLQVGLSELGAATQKDSYPGLSWSDVNKSDVLQNRTTSFADLYGWLVLDFFLYLLLALYCDNVIPSVYGTSRRWYYFMTPSYWTGKSRPSNKAPSKMKEENEVELKEIDMDVKAEEESVMVDGKLPPNTAVKIVNLNKVYVGDEEGGCCGCCSSCSRKKGDKKKSKNFYAVKNLCLSIQSDTLLCLLGPNGAGKTTTIHMLVGFHEATAGDALVFDKSIRENMSEIQREMGVCPQFDILWAELTGEEHLYLFSGLRNISGSSQDTEVDRLLDAVELQSARKMRSSSYSGGMRRRLSVAIALIGNPRIVFLDEPTTGMDPISRRKVWNIIEREKKGKVIVLTTHSMEEADILGDKVAIMGNGRLQCVGTSLRLKQRFGAGYRVTIGTTEDKVDNVRDFFKDHLPAATLHGTPIGGYLNFNIPRESTKDLIPCFKQLEKESKGLGIYDCQLSLTTLEEVFLTVAENIQLQRLAQSMSEQSDSETVLDVKEEDKPKKSRKGSIFGRDPEKKKAKISIRDQFKALFIKNALLQSRDRKTIACQVLTPLVLVVLLVAFNALIASIIDSDPISEVTRPKITERFHLLTLPPDASFSKVRDAENVQDAIAQNKPLLDYLAYLQSIGGPQLLYTHDPSLDAVMGTYGPNATSGILGKIDPPSGATFHLKLQEFSPYGTLPNTTFATPSLPFPFQMTRAENQEEIEETIYNAHDYAAQYTGGYLFKEMDFNSYTFRWSIFFNYSLTFMEDVPYLMNRITNAIALNFDQPSMINMRGVKEMPTEKDKGFEVDIINLAGPFFYILILHQLLPVFLSNIVAEKESKIKEIMSMMGLQMRVYWVVHYIFDYVLYCCVIGILIISGAIFQFRIFTINAFGSYFFLFFIWGHTLIAMSFLISVLFSNRKTSLIVGYFAILAIALICNVLVANVIGDFENVDHSKRFAISIVPPFALYRGLTYLAAEVSWKGPGYSMSNIDTPIVNLTEVYAFLIVEWVIMMILWVYLEQVLPSGWGVKKHPLFFLQYFGLFKEDKKKHLEEMQTIEKLSEDDEKNMPADVLAERKKMFNPKATEENCIQVLNLRKVYPSVDGNPPKVAVKGVSFGVKEKSCLGILGHNGAGKTTLIHMLIGLFGPSAGTAYISGHNLNEDLDAIHTIMGICPQHDVLWDNLTGKEHLLFYGRIKGLKGKRLKREVDRALKKVNLHYARNKVSQKYSGGMKRRLSVAIAIIGSPKVIYLDEPSTGLDPKSRQDLWGVINEAKQNSAVILTTHSMEEADAICDRLMIMSEGEIKCIGVSADLKNRFGQGFKVSTQVARGQDDRPADEFVKKLFPHGSLINELAGTRNYQVPKQDVALDVVFEAFETNKERLNITDWAITNTTLEEVFLKISHALGDEEPAEKQDKPKKDDEPHVLQINVDKDSRQYSSNEEEDEDSNSEHNIGEKKDYASSSSSSSSSSEEGSDRD